MRIAYLPMYSSPKNIRTCSTLGWANVFFRTLIQENEDVFLYFGWPRGVEFTLPWFDHPRVELVLFDPEEDQYTESWNVDRAFFERFGSWKGTHPIDVLLTDKHACVPDFRRKTEYPTIHNRRVTVVNMQFDFTVKQHEVSRNVESVQSVGVSESDLMICRDERVFEQIFTTARKHLSSKRAAGLLDKKWVGGYAFDEELFHENYRPDKLKGPPFLVSWGYAMAGGNKPVEIFEGVGQVIKEGRDLRMVVTTPSANGGNFHELLSQAFWGPFMTLDYALPRDKFYERLNQCHLFVNWTDVPGFSGSPLEQVAFGLLGIYHYVNRPPWVKDDYPFLFYGSGDLPAVIKDACDRYYDEDVQALIKGMQQEALEVYSGQRDARRLILKIRELSTYKKLAEQDSRRWLHDMILDILKIYQPDVIRWVEIQTWLWSRPESKKLTVGDATSGFGGFKVGSDHLRFVKEDLGWIDDCQEPLPMFRRMPDRAQPRFQTEEGPEVDPPVVQSPNTEE